MLIGNIGIFMRIHRQFLNRLDPNPEPQDVVVVIDVLRSFTTAAYAFAAGAKAIHPVETIVEALHLQQKLPRSVTTGAIAGGHPVPGFTYGNSPAALVDAELRGRDVVQTTAAGVRGLCRFSHTRAVFAGGLVCARATAAAIRERAPSDVMLLITGEWVDRDGDEDIACADYLERLLCNQQPDPRPYEARVRNSDFGRRFGLPENPHLPSDDLALCASADVFDFAMRASRSNQQLQLHAIYPDR